MGLDKGMRHRAVDGNPELMLCHQGGSTGKACNVARPRRHQPGLCFVCAAQTEIDQQFARGGERYARGFRGNERLKMQDIDQARFDELRLLHRCDDTQDRLVFEDDSPLGDGVDITGKAKACKVIQ